MVGRDTRLHLYGTHVVAEWVDYNGHMNDACYGIVFSRTVDALMVYLGMDAEYRKRTRCSIFTLEAHTRYLAEVNEGEVLRVSTELIGVDHKRLHIFLSMYTDGGTLSATCEQMLMHMNLEARSAATFSAHVQKNVDELWAAQFTLGLPAGVGHRFAVLTHARSFRRGKP